MNNYLIHHGVKGQKWGVRRYQNADGSLTDAGKKRYGSSNVNVSEESFGSGNGKYTTHLTTVGTSGNNLRNRRNADSSWKEKDEFDNKYDKAYDKFDVVGEKAAQMYKSGNKDGAVKYIIDSFKNYDYAFAIDNTISNTGKGKSYISWELEVYGTKDYYRTVVESSPFGDYEDAGFYKK